MAHLLATTNNSQKFAVKTNNFCNKYKYLQNLLLLALTIKTTVKQIYPRFNIKEA